MTVGAAGWGAGRARVNHHALPANTTTTAAVVRAIARAVPLDAGAGSPVMPGGGTSLRVEPHRHVASLCGTRR